MIDEPGSLSTDVPGMSPATLPPQVVAAVTAGEVVAHIALMLIEQQNPPPQ